MGIAKASYTTLLIGPSLALWAVAGFANAEDAAPLVETFDGGWQSGNKTVECKIGESAHKLDVAGGTARLTLDGEYKPPIHIRYSPAGVLYIFGDTETGVSGVAFDFVNNQMVKRDFVPDKSDSTPYSDRIACTILEQNEQ